MTNESERKRWWRTRGGIALIGFLAIAGFFLVTEHTAHVFGVLPYVLLLACPLLHFFIHGHRHGGDGPGGPARQHGDPGPNSTNRGTP